MQTKVWTKQKLRNLLINNDVELTYERTDKEQVSLECTLNEEYIPEKQRLHPLPETVELSDGTSVDLSEGVVSVFNLKTRGWQTIRVSSIKDLVLI